jgi:hypothetical protein
MWTPCTYVEDIRAALSKAKANIDLVTFAKHYKLKIDIIRSVLSC